MVTSSSSPLPSFYLPAPSSSFRASPEWDKRSNPIADNYQLGTYETRNGKRQRRGGFRCLFVLISGEDRKYPGLNAIFSFFITISSKMSSMISVFLPVQVGAGML